MGETIRVVFVTNVPAPYKTPRLNALAQLGDVDLHVIYANRRTNRHEYESIPERNFSYELNSSTRIPFLGGELMIDSWSIKRLMTINADVFIVGGWNYFAAWSAFVASEVRDIPIGIVSENTEQRTWLSKKVITRVLGRFDICFGTSERAGEHFRRLGVPEERIVVLPYTVDVSRFQQELDPETRTKLTEQYNLDGKSVILYVGLLEQHKGIDDLITATAELELPDVHLLIVGDGPDRERLRRLADEQLDVPVTFAGYVPNRHVPRYYAIADIFVLPTYNDPWGLVLNEALASGTPAVTTTAAGAVDELIQDGSTGLVVPSGDVSALSTAITDVLTDDSLRRTLSEGGLSVSENYTPEQYASTMRSAIVNVLNAW